MKTKLRWTIKIKDDKKKRIIIKYSPIDDTLTFVGQCQLPNDGWVDFTEIEITAKDVKLKTIEDNLTTSFEKLIERFDVYDDLNKGLNIIESIDFSDDDKKEFEEDYSVYGNLEE